MDGGRLSPSNVVSTSRQTILLISTPWRLFPNAGDAPGANATFPVTDSEVAEDFEKNPAAVLELQMRWTREVFGTVSFRRIQMFTSSDKTRRKQRRSAVPNYAGWFFRRDEQEIFKIAVARLLFQLNIVSVSFDTSYVFFLAAALARYIYRSYEPQRRSRKIITVLTFAPINEPLFRGSD